jgi:hypothetical protein
MPGDKTAEQSKSDRQGLPNRLKRTTFALLFSAILLIPRMRRLRRKVLVWTLVRVLAVLAGAWLGWQFARGTAGVPSLSFAVALVIFGLAVRARPERKSVDDVAREINALVVLNGGAWINGEHSKPVKGTHILVVSDRLVVLTSKLHQIAEIHLPSVRQVRAQALFPGSAPKNGDRAAVPWQTELLWSLGGQAHSAAFHFDGFFAEHLARVAEQTITSVWKKQLPVLRA